MGNFHKDFTNYQPIPRALIFDNNLSDRARFVYIYLTFQSDEFWNLPLTTKAEMIGYSVSMFKRCLDELIKSGWMVVKGDDVTLKAQKDKI